MLTSSMLTTLSWKDRPFIYTITLLSVLLYFILYYICTLIVWRCCLDWFPFSTDCLESSKRCRLSFFLECMLVCVRVCEMQRVVMMVCHSAWDGTTIALFSNEIWLDLRGLIECFFWFINYFIMTYVSFLYSWRALRCIFRAQMGQRRKLL